MYWKILHCKLWWISRNALTHVRIKWLWKEKKKDYCELWSIIAQQARIILSQSPSTTANIYMMNVLFFLIDCFQSYSNCFLPFWRESLMQMLSLIFNSVSLVNLNIRESFSHYYSQPWNCEWVPSIYSNFLREVLEVNFPPYCLNLKCGNLNYKKGQIIVQLAVALNTSLVVKTPTKHIPMLLNLTKLSNRSLITIRPWICIFLLHI